ncbi:hypothetical protein [Rhodococcus qingshengii]|uniref:hypothetical protein n=1 Tax=Rhodococcus qingshengii TaxID=334542 RepID=UPI0036DC7421
MTDVDLLSHHTSLIRCGDSILSKFGGTAETDTAAFAAMAGFASVIGMAPIKLHKEKGGRILNSLLVPFLNAAAAPAAGEYADLVAVDQRQRSPPVPRCALFQIYDIKSLCPRTTSWLAVSLYRRHFRRGRSTTASPRESSASIPVQRSVAIPLNEMGNNVLQQWKLRSVRTATQA